jgi:hypothetical protein
MGRSETTTTHQARAYQTPTVTIPTISIPQPDGAVLIRPGKPTILEDRVRTDEAARILGMSQRWVEAECITGKFRTARKVSMTQKGRWTIYRSEVFSRLDNMPD